MDIGRYTVLGRLGRGGMGVVYKVRHRTLGRIMALKLLQPNEFLVELWGEEGVRAAFLREARMLAACAHDHVARVWDLDEDHGRPFLVLEYLCMHVGLLIGEAAVLEQPTRIPPRAQALDIVRQALHGLAYLHAQGIVHRDIKPGNMMLDRNGRVLLIDFGLSLRLTETWLGPKGLKIGSPGYCAPEQEVRPELADGRADLYALGAVLHRLLTGVLPDTGQIPDLHAQDAAFFARALAPRPEDRFQKAQEMLYGLDDLGRVDAQDAYACPEAEEPCAVMVRPRCAPLRTGVVARPFAFLDHLFRPLVYHEGVLEPNNGGWVDRCMGLVWGEISPWPMEWVEGRAYISSLGPGWRMPTVEELITLVRPSQGLAHFCQRPFGERYLWVWTADQRSFTSAWFVDVGSGTVLAQDLNCRFFVRPVRSLDV